jgi:hypothetical protein
VIFRVKEELRRRRQGRVGYEAVIAATNAKRLRKEPLRRSNHASSPLWMLGESFIRRLRDPLARKDEVPGIRFTLNKRCRQAQRSRGAFRPSFAINFLTLHSEGAGNAGRSMRPQSRVQQKAHALATTVTPENTRHSPRNGFCGIYRVLSGDRAFLPSSPAEYLPQA